MANKIKSTLEAIGIISKEVGDMAEGVSGNASIDCVECGKLATHHSAYFCEECAEEFYAEGDGGIEGERGREE